MRDGSFCLPLFFKNKEHESSGCAPTGAQPFVRPKGWIKMRPKLLAAIRSHRGSLYFMPILSSLGNSPAAQTSSFEFLKISIAFRLRHTGVNAMPAEAFRIFTAKFTAVIRGFFRSVRRLSCHVRQSQHLEPARAESSLLTACRAQPPTGRRG